jgi:hypothetical protein
MKYVIATATIALLVGCAPEQVIIREPVEVTVIQTVPCLRPEDVPLCGPSVLDAADLRGKGPYTQAQSVLQDLESDRACKRELMAVITRCVESKK